MLRGLVCAAEVRLTEHAADIAEMIDGSRGDDTEEMAVHVKEQIESVLAGVRQSGSKLGVTLKQVKLTNYSSDWGMSVGRGI